MSDSEEDYMSDAFLAKCQDTRPGLAWGKAEKENEQEKKQKAKSKTPAIKPRHILEAEKRSEGLNTAIGENNKGFALLQKMGFKKGMTIGKKGTGRAEPVPVTLRSGRGGLGEDTERKRKQTEMAAMRVEMMKKRQKQEATFQADYREQRSKTNSERQMERDLYGSQRVCEQLDEEQGYDAPVEGYFWTEARMKILKQKQQKQEESSSDEESEGFHFQGESGPQAEEIEEDEPLSEKLEAITEYLRDTYFYCVWCGTRFADLEDLQKNCEGNTYDAHNR